jgi:hypothetical protein
MSHLPTGVLLELRDRHPDEAEAAHLLDCPSCLTAIEAARAVRARLRALPLEAPPPGLWEQLAQAPLPAPVPLRPRRSAPVLAFALAAAAALILLLPNRLAAPADDSDLVKRSQELEAALQALPDQGELELQAAETFSQVNDLLSSIDQSLAGTPDGEAKRALWQRRVELLESLLRLRASQQALVSL